MSWTWSLNVLNVNVFNHILERSHQTFLAVFIRFDLCFYTCSFYVPLTIKNVLSPFISKEPGLVASCLKNKNCLGCWLARIAHEDFGHSNKGVHRICYQQLQSKTRFGLEKHHFFFQMFLFTAAKLTWACEAVNSHWVRWGTAVSYTQAYFRCDGQWVKRLYIVKQQWWLLRRLA